MEILLNEFLLKTIHLRFNLELFVCLLSFLCNEIECLTRFLLKIIHLQFDVKFCDELERTHFKKNSNFEGVSDKLNSFVMRFWIVSLSSKIPRRVNEMLEWVSSENNSSIVWSWRLIRTEKTLFNIDFVLEGIPNEKVYLRCDLCYYLLRSAPTFKFKKFSNKTFVEVIC